jgi:HD-GYP domain-containing protein (c-di-GMP phosphodiesterase class II)
MSSKDAMKELKQNAGKQFDPKLIDTFLPIALSTVSKRRRRGKAPIFQNTVEEFGNSPL